MKHLLVAALLLAPAVLAGEPLTFESTATQATLIELFSSEGCSSCPPAEAWMSRLKRGAELWKSVAPVVWHVDYWDNLGWPDRFASSAFTERRGWADRTPLPAPASTKTGILRVVFRDRTLAEVVFSPTSTMATPPVAELALLGGELEVDVKRGENSGRKLRHDFVALHLVTATLRSDGNRFVQSIALPANPKEPPTAFAAWVTTGDTGRPLQATGGWLPRK
ncbi:MAG: hypothetical protein QOE70_5632 [Chthoniobacter sp.]|jgi:hypothetical protein|nr:hypothetical protein [Chthoniobacter sp.]